MNIEEILWNLLMTDLLIVVVVIGIMMHEGWFDSDKLKKAKVTMLFKVANFVFKWTTNSLPIIILGYIWV